MAGRSRFLSLLTVLAIVAMACQPAAPAPTTKAPSAPAATAAPTAAAKQQPATKQGGLTRVTIGVTETIEKRNPYADSVSLLYGIWCEVLGCLMSYDFEKAEYVGRLAESWKVENPTTWIFNLRKGVKWHDGSPFTAVDVVHSVDRTLNDPNTRQTQNVPKGTKVEIVDDHTVRVITPEPVASLLDYWSDLLIITSKAQFDKHGEQVWEQNPVGTGPYMLKELIPDQRMTIVKNPNWWGGEVQGPDEVVYRVIREPEVRVTALLNDELQIAQFVPPHMAERLSSNPSTKIVTSDSIEIMFLAMQPKPPFDKKEVRQAVAHAIDRDAIIQGVLQGQATRLDGPVGPGQYGYDPELAKRLRYPYDPAKARELLAQAGYPNGVDVELSTPVGRYILDKQISEAVAQMLTEAGIRTTLLTPEWPTLWDNVQKGNVPFYYMGRGSVIDPGRPLSQYFETGVSPRIGYSNPELDALFAKERAAFDPAERKKALGEVFTHITEEAPAHFMWRHQMLWGMTRNIEFNPRPDARIFANDIRVQ